MSGSCEDFLLKITNGISNNWLKMLMSEDLIKPLSNVLINLKNHKNIDDITPSISDIFSFAKYCPLNEIKVIIFGQDPYPKKGDAHGIAFSSNSISLKPSLRNVYKCLENSGLISNEEYKLLKTSNLSYWASQGVLLLNSSLTTIVNKPNEHEKLWKEYTDLLIVKLANYTDYYIGKPVFLLWGNVAIAKQKMLKNSIVYTWIHPSPLAQRVEESKKFINCDHFKLVNKHLSELNVKKIDWTPNPFNVVYTDGACSENGGGIYSKAGFAVYFNSGIIRNKVIYGKVKPAILKGEIVYGTNIRGEGIAILEALKCICKKNNSSYIKIRLVTDSEFWKKTIEEYMPSWESKKKSFEEHKNHDITIPLYEIVKRIKQKGILDIVFIKSHNKDKNGDANHIIGNAIADKYAVLAKNLNNYDTIVEKIDIEKKLSEKTFRIKNSLTVDFI